MHQQLFDTTKKNEVIDITAEVTRLLPKQGSGWASVFVCHTTAAITAMDLDPGTDQDLMDFLRGIVPKQTWRHPHDPSHAPDHLLAALIGPELSIPYENGALLLGSWQRIVLVELDGPRQRKVLISV